MRRARRLELGSVADAVAGLRAAIETPLGALVGGRRLRDLRPADRLDELAFEFPLVGGDDPSGRLTLARSPPFCASTCDPGTRSPGTPTGLTTRRCARASAAI